MDTKDNAISAIIEVLEKMVLERTYQYCLEIDTLQMKLANEEKTSSILHSDRNEVFKLWDMHKYRLEIAKEALEWISCTHSCSDDCIEDSRPCFKCRAAQALVKINEE